MYKPAHKVCGDTPYFGYETALSFSLFSKSYLRLNNNIATVSTINNQL